MHLFALLGSAVSAFFSFMLRVIIGFWGKLSVFIGFMLPGVVSAVLKLLGIGLVSFTGFYVVIDSLKAFVMNKFGGISSDLLQILSLMKVDVGIAMVFAAMSIAVTVKMTTKAATMVWRKPGSGAGGSMQA